MGRRMVSTDNPIQAHEGVGAIRLGVSREDLRRLLGPPSYYDASKDFFFDASMHAHFSLAGTLELIVVAPGPFIATFEGTDLLGVDAASALSVVGAFAAVDELEAEYPLSCTFPSLDLNLWRSCLPEDEVDGDAGRRFEALGIGERGYFSRRRAS